MKKFQEIFHLENFKKFSFWKFQENAFPSRNFAQFQEIIWECLNIKGRYHEEKLLFFWILSKLPSQLFGPNTHVLCSMFSFQSIELCVQKVRVYSFRWWGRWGEPILGNYHHFRFLQSHGPLRRMVISELSTFRTNCLDFPLKMHRLSYNPKKLDEKSKTVSSQVFALNNNRVAYQFSKCIF